jgi:hypothetical protein
MSFEYSESSTLPGDLCWVVVGGMLAQRDNGTCLLLSCWGAGTMRYYYTLLLSSYFRGQALGTDFGAFRRSFNGIVT